MSHSRAKRLQPEDYLERAMRAHNDAPRLPLREPLYDADVRGARLRRTAAGCPSKFNTNQLPY